MTATSILIIEDDPAIRHVLREALSDEGYRVAEATNGQEGLDALAASHPDAPHAIVLDLMMPVMDGWRFRAEQRQRDLAPDTPVIVLSASRRAISAVADLDASLVIPKPFDLDELLSAIADATGR
jgi:two-component system, chemotaxis family, chemotaxis protein CheY